MRYFLFLLLGCVLFFSSAQADNLTAVGTGAAQFCCVDGSIMMDATQSTPWEDIDEIWWDWESDSTYDDGGDRDYYDVYPAEWSSGGAYYVTLKVINTTAEPDEFDTDTSEEPFYVGEPIIAASAWGGRDPLYVSFDASNSLPSELSQTYEWDFEYSGSFSPDATGATANYTYTPDDTYTVALRVTYDGNSSWVCTAYGQIVVTP
jgi:hypothetical protein